MTGYIGAVKEAYSEPHRRWHTMKHINDMFAYCGDDISEELFYAILWHDYIYIPGAKDNEEKSALAWEKHYDGNNYLEDVDREKVADMIRATALPFDVLRDESISNELRTFILADFDIFTKGKEELIAYEKAIFYEFQKYELSDYIQGRTDVLKWIQSNYYTDEVEYAACSFLIDYINTKTYKIGIYAGSFNPYHIGHEDVVQQAEKMFDKVIIAQGWNREKNPAPAIEGNYREVVIYPGLLVDMFGENERVEKTLIRGLRNSFDVGYEDNLRNTLFDFKQIPIVYFFCRKEHEHISSSMVRGLMSFGDVYKKYLPKPGVEIHLTKVEKLKPIDWGKVVFNPEEE